MATRSSKKAAPKRTNWPRIFLVTGIGILFLLVVSIGSTYGVYARWREVGKIAPHYYIQGENVGNLTAAQAKERLVDRFGRLFVTLHAPDRDFKLSLGQLGGKLQYDHAVKTAQKYGRGKSEISNLLQFWFTSQKDIRAVLPLRWDNDALRRTMWTVANIYNQKPRNASLQVTANTVSVEPEKLGRAMNVPQAIKKIQETYYPGLPELKIDAQIKQPSIRTAELVGQDVLLGKYRTRFNPGNEGRSTNVRLAAEAVQGMVLMPGETFSFNRATGERTPRKGYQVAKIFVRLPDEEKAKIVDGVGGGVCQVSSTLFNAVRISNEQSEGRLKIVERYHHSLPVSYVPEGQDATVAWPYKDFRFRNKYSFPIYLRSAIKGPRLTLSVWGRIPNAEAPSYVALNQKKTNEDKAGLTQ